MDSNRRNIRKADKKNIPQADGGKAAIRSRDSLLVQQSRRRIQRIVIGAASLLTVITLYTVISNLPENNPVLMPPPQLVLATLWKRILDVSMIEATLSSLKRVAIGYFVGAGSAIIIGTLMGWFRFIEYVIDPIVESLRPIPPLAYIPLVILWFGIGEVSRILVITASAFLTCIVNAYTGMKQVPKVYVDAAETLGANQFTVFRTIALPSALPYIFAGLRVAMAASWTTLVAAELIAAQSGLGFLLQTGRRYFKTELVIAGIIVIGILAFSMDRLFRKIQARFTRWAEVK
jgi:ABC-type nitrate/sulfonate/bicarbonate transport system permease component